MTLQISVAQQNARLDIMATNLGPSPVLKIRTSAPPASLASPDAGTVLATLSLPATFMLPAANGTKAMTGSWADNAADAAGTCGHFRFYANDGTTAHWQGTITAPGGGGDMTIDNIIFAVGQGFSITSFAITDSNG